MAGARRGMCELTVRYGRGTSWARHAMCESAFIVLQIRRYYPPCFISFVRKTMTSVLIICARNTADKIDVCVPGHVSIDLKI